LFLEVQIDGGERECKDVIKLVQSRPNSTTEALVRIAPVIGLHAPPTKSGPYILRLAQRRYGINSHWLSWPHHIESVKGLSQLIFVDDFCGTGQQFIEFAQSIRLSEMHSANNAMKISYFVAAAHEDGMNSIKQNLPFIQIKCAERLGPTNSVLQDKCFGRYQIKGFQDLVLQQYTDVLEGAGLPRVGKLAQGFGSLGLAYGFAHATPNNTLPIFWYETESWTPLLDR